MPESEPEPSGAEPSGAEPSGAEDRAHPVTVVVGYDGSSEARPALRWAVHEAKLRGGRLRVVTAWEWPTMYGMIPSGFDPEADARDVQNAAIEEELGSEPDLEVERVLMEGSAAPNLVDASRGATLLVVGNRGRGGFKGLLLGSVSEQCAHHATCPVTIVR